YKLEHNFGHGKKTLASLLVTLNLLAFAFHTAAQLSVLAWRTAPAKRGAGYVFFEHLRTITAYIVFPDWSALLHAIAAPTKHDRPDQPSPTPRKAFPPPKSQEPTDNPKQMRIAGAVPSLRLHTPPGSGRGCRRGGGLPPSQPNVTA
ncbi:MAG: hypothetical protein GC191_10685, partial [Azospirillum sp.]|nr:hypothetical protein [Azospirillum sp.]